MKTTLNKIREYKPCSGGWETLLKSLNKTKSDDEDLCLLTILESNGLKDTLWCLKAVEGFEREKRLFAVWCASQVKYLMKDQRSLDALKVAEDFAEGGATEKELKDAYDNAFRASRHADAEAAYYAAGAAYYAAACSDAAYYAVYYAHCAAYYAVYYASTRNAAAHAARVSQQKEFIRMLTCIKNNERYEIN